MTKNAFLHSHGHLQQPKEFQPHSKSRSRACWIPDAHYTNTVSSSNSSQGVGTYCTIDGPGPPGSARSLGRCCHSNTDVNLPRCGYGLRSDLSGRVSSNASSRPSIHPAAPAASVTSRTNNVFVNYHHPSPIVRRAENPSPQYFSNTNYLSSATYQQQPFVDAQLENALFGATAVPSSNRSSDRPVTPVSITTTDGVVAPCGGHCRTFERFCHYSLLVAFVIGIISGICLVLAGYILHGQKRGAGDLLVLVYIGALIAIVCTLLLSIQCNVQRDAKKRKRKRASMMMARNARMSSTEFPLRHLRSASAMATTDYNARHQQLTSSMVQRLDGNLDDNPSACEVPLMRGTLPRSVPPYRNCDEMSESQNGIPWWRREETQVTFKYGNVV